MKTIIKEYGKKFLSLVMAVVMTLTLVNLAPFAEEAKAIQGQETRIHVCVPNGQQAWGADVYNVSGQSGTFNFSSEVTDTTNNYDWYIITLSNGFTPNPGGGIIAINASVGGYQATTVTEVTNDYYILIKSDGSREVINFDTAVANYEYPGGSAAMPDMVITNLWWEPASPNVGDKVTFHVTIKNEGTAATPSNQTNGVAFWIDEQKLNLWSGTSYGAIQPGQSVNVQADGGEITWTATQGSHTLRAMVDDAGRYTESNEDNNTKEATINVAAASTPASLEITALSPMEVTVGQPVTFTATIKNTGGSSRQFGSGNGVLFIVDGFAHRWNDESYELKANEEHQFTANGGGPTFTFNEAGTKTVTVRTEGGNGVNAEKSFTINVVAAQPKYPDMVIENLWWEPASPNAGDKVTFHATIKNQGTAATPSDQYTGVAFWINGQKLNLWTGSDGAIQPGQSVNVQADSGDITWTAIAGSHTLRAMVDDAYRYTESNEDNNTKEATINVAAATTTTITFVSQNSGIQKDDARIYVIEGTINSGDFKDGNNVMTKGTAMTETTDGTWTATISSSTSVVTFVRVSRSSDGNYYWGQQWENTQRGTETVFTATGTNGEGYWGEGSEQPTTAAPSGGIYGTPLTDTEIKDLSHLELEDVVDNNGGAQELFVVPAVLYNYKPSGGGYWDQFINLDKAIMNTYYGSDKMRYPLVLGAPNSWWDGNDRPLGNLVPGFNDSLTQMQALWFINHNLEWYGHTGGAGTGISSSAPVQGLVAGFLSVDGQLLSAENNVIMPLFDDRFLGTTGEGNVVDGTWATKYGNMEDPLSFPFRVEGNYYVFDSASGTDNIKVVDGAITYNSSSSAQVKNLHDGKTGFFPFDNGGDSGESGLSFGYGARFDIPFNVVNGNANNVTPTVASKTASIGWNNSSVQTWTVDLGTTLTAGQTYTIVLDSDMGGGITWDYLSIDGQNKYFGDKSWYSVEGDVSYLRVNDINSSSDCLSKIDGKILMTITPSSNISSFKLHGKTYDKNYNLGVNVYSGSKTFDSIVYPPEDIVFNFSGDDDLWVYVDGKLVLDIGGAHTKASGNINFTDGTVTVNNAYAMNYGSNSVSATGVTTKNVDWIKFDDPNVTHTMTVFYLERGLGDSNLKISFNFNPVRLTQRNGLTVSNKVDLSDINNGFLTDLDAYDFDFTYDAYDVTDYNMSGNKDLLFAGGKITITGDGSKTAYLEQEHSDGTGTIRGDEAKVTQNQYDNFDTSYELINTSGNVINSSTSDNPYNVVDGKLTNGETSDIYFELEDGSGADSNLHIEAAFTNKAKVTSLTLSKLDNSIAHDEGDQYTFIVEYTKLLGVAKTGFFSGEYTITDTRNGSTRTSATSNGEITIYAYEVVTINGVPVDSEIRISEKNDGNYIKTVVTTSAAAEVEIDNDEFYTITSDPAVTYDWQIVNGDKNTAVYFAEVGTAVIINCGDELANIQLSSTTKTGEFRYQVEVPADTITVNAPSSNSVTGGADLVVTDISWGGQDIAVGDEVVFTVTVKNVGDTAVPKNQVIGLDIVVDGNSSNMLYCDTYANGLAPGATVTLTINSGTSGAEWIATNGEHTFRANIDDRGTVSEVNESNNYYEMTFTTPYEAGGIEQRVATTTYSYHEEIIAGAVSGTIGTVSHTKDSITYTYPGSESAGEDVFYYEVAQIADSDVVVNGQTIVRAGEVYYTTSTAAKVYSYKLSDDVYVLDYGLPVILSEEPNHLMANDVTSLSGVATTLVDMGYAVSGTALATGKPANGVYVKSNAYANEGNGSFGKATLNGSEYKYSLNKLFDGIETFYYGVQVTAAGASGTLNAANATPIMTSKVTVVPASVVYYEDNFSYDSTSGTTSAITYTGNGVVVNNTGLDITQSNSLNDLYGFDEAYDNMIGDGLGSTLLAKSQTVSFTFKGTGFDIVARTADTATVLYVVSKDNKLVEMGNVDTYYDAGVLYQLPVISVQDLEYGEYKVQFMILTSSAYSEFYFDGIRIYNPLGAGSDYYNSYENGAEVTPIIDMILGDCTFTETGIYDANGNLIESTNTVPDGSQISVVGGMITEDLGNATIKNGSSLADLLSDGPNNEVYLGDGSKLVFYATKNNEVANDADRTLQVEVKAIANKNASAVDTGLDLSLNSTKDVIASIDTNTAMYYEIPMSLCEDKGNGQYLVVINGASADDYNLSFTNLKVKGYDITPYVTATSSSSVHITDVTVNGSSSISFERKTEVEFVVTLSENVAMNEGNFSLTANGKDVTIRSVEAVAGTSNQYVVKTLAPNVVGTFTYSFAYTNADDKVAVTSVSATVTATAAASGNRPAVPSRPR